MNNNNIVSRKLCIQLMIIYYIYVPIKKLIQFALMLIRLETQH